MSRNRHDQRHAPTNRNCSHAPPKQVSQISKNLFLKQSLTGRFICFANGIDVLDDKMVWYMDDAHGAAFRKPSVSDGIIKCCHS
jgi:hypothetical protein